MLAGPVTETPVSAHGRWSPYTDNGGTLVVGTSDDCVVCMADTRLSTGFRIHCRSVSKCSELTPTVMIASAGQQSEILTLHKILKIRVEMYRHEHRQFPTIKAMAQMLSTVLYSKRFFPFYTFNVLFGLDSQGKGAAYEYDAVGSFERVNYSAQGSGRTLVISVLDNQFRKSNQLIPGPKSTKEDLINQLKNVITGAAERDIRTGDSAEIFVIDTTGIHRDMVELRKD